MRNLQLLNLSGRESLFDPIPPLWMRVLGGSVVVAGWLVLTAGRTSPMIRLAFILWLPTAIPFLVLLRDQIFNGLRLSDSLSRRWARRLLPFTLALHLAILLLGTALWRYIGWVRYGVVFAIGAAFLLVWLEVQGVLILYRKTLTSLHVAGADRF